MVLILIFGVLYVAVVGWKIVNVMDKFDDTYNETGEARKSIHKEVKNERRKKKIRAIFKREME